MQSEITKLWGKEVVLHNENYCSKLVIYSGPHMSSEHYHEKKHETFVIVRGLFGVFLADPQKMPGEWAQAAQNLDERARARVIADYIAGMTDRYALAQAQIWLGAPAGLGDAALIAPGN